MVPRPDGHGQNLRLGPLAALDERGVDLRLWSGKAESDGESHYAPESNPPRELDLRQPGRFPQDGIDRRGMRELPKIVVQAAQDRHDDEAAGHREKIATLAATPLGEQSDQENPEQRPVGVAENSEHDGDDARVLHD